MKKKILVRPYNYESINTTFNQSMTDCGDNSGNIIWYEGIKDSIKYDMEKTAFEIFDTDGTYILSLANHININSEGLEINNKLFKRKKDVVIVSLGAQLTNEFNTPKKLIETLPKERVKALQNLSEKCVSIGIRGEITAECLDLIGVHNYKVIGCPSFYSNKKIIQELCHKEKNINENSVLGINLASYGRKQLAYFLNELNQKGFLDKSYFILQHMLDMPKTIYEDMPILQRHIEAKYPGLNMSAKEWEDYIKNHGKIFFNKEEWLYFIKENISLSMGLRFHGNMASILAGVPAVWITHDSRTLEMCEIMDLPHMGIEEIDSNFDVEKVIELKEQYNLQFWDKYCKKYEYYKAFLKENGLELKEE